MKFFFLSFISIVAIPFLIIAQQSKSEPDYLRKSKDFIEIIWYNNPTIKISLSDLKKFGLLVNVQDSAISQIKYCKNVTLQRATSFWQNIDSVSPNLSFFTFNAEDKSQFKTGTMLYTILSNMRNDLSPDQIICEWKVGNDSLIFGSILLNVFSTYYGDCGIESVDSISKDKKIITVHSIGGDGGAIWHSLSFYLYSFPNKMKLLHKEDWGEGINEDASESLVSLHLKIDASKRTASIKLTEKREKGKSISNSTLLEKVIYFDNLISPISAESSNSK